MGLKGILEKIGGPIYQAQRSQTKKSALKYRHYLKLPVIKQTVLYEVRDGKSMTDSPKAIFDYLLTDDSMRDYHHIWSVTPSPELEKIMAQYEGYPNVTFVERQSDDYLKWLAQAEFLINNATFQSFVLIREEQTYINTWHGTPLKKMGLDIKQSPKLSRNVIRNFHMADYLLSPNAHTTSMYLDAYRLRGGYEGELLESGYPRMDRMFDTSRDALTEQLAEFGIRLASDKKVVLYAPTWKGSVISEARNDKEQLTQDILQLVAELGDEYQVFLKAHPFLYTQVKDVDQLRPYLIPDVLDTNELLAHTDILITDYSSIFFDFLVTGKPIIFYTWDEDIYAQSRGAYFELETLPGPICYRIETVISAIHEKRYEHESIKQNYQAYQHQFVAHDDGHATARYVHHIFGDKKLRPVTTNDSKKIKLFIYPGGMMNNGITSSFLNLVKSIDYQKYDVTCLLGLERTKDQKHNIQQIPKEVHLLYRTNDELLTIKESYQAQWIQLQGITQRNKKWFPLTGFRYEMRRVVGKKHYDIAIDFSGYSLYWSRYILATPSHHHMVYLHSDMKADQLREVNGKKIHQLNLKGMFSVYPYYDDLVSVSPVLNEVNRQKLEGLVADNKFVALPNSLDLEKLFDSKVMQEEKTWMIREVGGRYQFIDDQASYVIYETLDDLSQNFEYVVTDTSVDILRLAEAQLDDELFYKIMVDEQYLGWIRSEDLDELPDEVLLTKEAPRLAKFMTDKAVRLYQRPYDLPDNQLLYEGSLKGLIIEPQEKVVTYHAHSLPVVIAGDLVGWVSQREVLNYRFYQQKEWRWLGKMMRWLNHKQNRALIQHITFVKKTVRYQTLYFESLTRQTANIYPDFNKKEKECTITFEKHQAIMAHAVAEAHDEAFYHIQIGRDTGWIKASELDLVTVTLDTPTLLWEEPFNGVAETATAANVPIQAKRYYTHNQTTYLLADGTEQDTCRTHLSTEFGTYNNQDQYITYPQKNEEPIFITVGRLSPEKNQHLLLEAFQEYRVREGKGKLWVVGDGPLKNDLAQQVEQMGLEEHVTLTGHVPNPYPFMERADCFVLTSYYEGQPIVLLEALSLGLNVISTDNPGCRYVLEDGRFGSLIPQESPEQLATAMQEMMTDETHQYKSFDAQAYNQATIEMFDQFIKQRIKE